MTHESDITLDQLRIGDRAVVTGYAADAGQLRSRLLAMGLTRGTEFTFVRSAPGGDPIELRARGFSLSLRRAEAASLTIRRATGVDPRTVGRSFTYPPMVAR